MERETRRLLGTFEVYICSWDNLRQLPRRPSEVSILEHQEEGWACVSSSVSPELTTWPWHHIPIHSSSLMMVWYGANIDESLIRCVLYQRMTRLGKGEFFLRLDLKQFGWLH